MRDSYFKTRISCYVGYVVQAVINNCLPILFIILQDEYHLTYEKLGRIILINFLTQLCADISAPKIVDKIGYKGAAVMSQALAAIGFILLAIFPEFFPDPYVGVIAAVMVYAVGSGLMEVIVSPIIELLPSENKSGSMAILHSFYSWGQAFAVVLTTAMVHIFGGGQWKFIPLIWAIIPFINTFSFLNSPIIEPQKENNDRAVWSMVRTKEFACFIIFMVCAGASELAMSQWASMFAQRGLGINKALGDLLGPCAFALLMGSGRLFYGLFAGRYSVKKALIFNNILCAACYITAGLSRHPIPALLACALCGFSISLSWPGTFSLAAARFPLGGTFMFSVLALCGDLGCSLGPWFLGIIADNSSLQTGFLVSTVFPILMIITALFLPKKYCKTN